MRRSWSTVLCIVSSGTFANALPDCLPSAVHACVIGNATSSDVRLCIDDDDFDRRWESAQVAMTELDACLAPLHDRLAQGGSVQVFVRDAHGVMTPLGDLDTSDVLAKSGQPTAHQSDADRAVETGALAGASIFLSAGHGWRYSDALGRWGTQRGNSYGVIEDHTNAEALNQYLVPLLERAGARVYTARERDWRTDAQLLDDGHVDVVRSPGWHVQASPGAHGGSHLVHVGAPVNDAFVFYPFRAVVDAPADVYLWHETSAAKAATEVSIEIFHAAGRSTRVLDQRQDGDTWRHVGRYMFRAGDVLQGVRLAAPDGAQAIGWVADAVRFGGGVGDVVDPIGGTASGYPRWEDSGRYHVGYLGFPGWVNSGTVNAMPRWAAWEHEPWESGRSVYVAWHSNAADSATARGTSSFAYASSGFQGPFTGVAGGLQLRDAIHSRIAGAVQALWDADWNDRGVYTHWFGEISSNHNPEMPASLHEMAFHTSPDDAASLLDPRFRGLVARAVYQGIQTYYRDNVAGYDVDEFLPPPPTHLSIDCTSDGRANVRWREPDVRADRMTGDAPDHYRLYRSSDARDLTVYAESPSTTLMLDHLTSRKPTYVRVTAVNAAGESLPTEVLGCVPPTAVEGAARVLVVSGFDRLDAGLNEAVDDPFDSDPRVVGRLDRMNTFDYVEQYLAALSTLGISADAISNEALKVRGSADPYSAVVWILGEESSADKTLDAQERAIVAAHLDADRRLLISGSELAWELDHLNADESFIRGRLGVAYAMDDAGSNAAHGVPGSLFDGLSLQFGGAAARFPVEWPDAFALQAGSSAVLHYDSNPPRIAAAEYSTDGMSAPVFTFGFPIESIEQDEVRRELLKRMFDRWGLLPDDTIFADAFEWQPEAGIDIR